MNPTASAMNDLVSQIAKHLVDRPEEVMVRTVEGTNTMVLELYVNKSDVGKIIGKQGRTAHALRTLVGAVSSKINKRAVLEIIE